MIHLKRYYLLLCSIIIGGLLLSACNFPGRSTPDTGFDAIQTSAAKTVIAEVTRDALQTANPTILAPTATIGLLPTFTPNGEIPTYTSTPIPIPSATPIPPPTPIPPTPIPCNRAQFISDVTVPDGTKFPPSALFTKVWRLKNVGACNWDQNYNLIFTTGTAMTNDTVIALSTTVRPGETIDLSVLMVSPQNPGRYRSQWLLRASNGQIFGTGREGQAPIWAEIQVVIPEGVDLTRDLALGFCTANWQTGAGRIGCTNPTYDSAGSVALQTDPRLESRNENEPSLWVRPNVAQNGFIRGTYTPLRVLNGDHFVSEIGCLRDSTGCDVTFQLDYILGGITRNLGSWREVYDGNTRIVDVDLSSLQGNTIQLVLSVNNNGDPKKANAFWFVPSVRNKPLPTPTPTSPPPPQLVMTWEQRGGTLNVCNRLEVYLDASGASAIAKYCSTNQEINRIRLLPEETSQIISWLNIFVPFIAQDVDAGTGDGKTFTLDLDGRGITSPTQGDIRAIQNWAEAIFLRMGG